MNFASLPPVPKPRLDSEMVTLVSEADRQISFLDGALSLLPENHYMFSILTLLESSNSNKIDDASISISELFKANIGESSDTSNKILNYTNALNTSRRLLKNVSSSSHIIKSIHKELKTKNNAGEFRQSQVWVGRQENNTIDARYIPPSYNEVPSLMSDLENYVASDISYPVVINAALIHAQFEMIHPFADANGLVGRILFQLHMLWKKKLTFPALLLSRQLLSNKNEYFDSLENLERTGNWELWIKYFTKTISAATLRTTELIKKIATVEECDYQKIIDKEFASSYSLKLFRLMLRQPILTVPFITKELDFNKQTANTIIKKFLDENILEESTGKQRNREFVYKDYLNILEA